MITSQYCGPIVSSDTCATMECVSNAVSDVRLLSTVYPVDPVEDLFNLLYASGRISVYVCMYAYVCFAACFADVCLCHRSSIS